MRGKRRSLIALVAVAALVAAGCGGDDSSSSSSGSGAADRPSFEAGTTMARIQERGRLVVGTKFDQPLVGFRDPASGKIIGFDAEMARDIAEAIFGERDDRYIEFKSTPSNVREESIQNGTVDVVIASYTINDARKQQVDFAGPYYEAGQDIFVKKSDTSINGVDDLNGKKVCSVQGSTSLKNVQEKAPEADLSITFDSYALCAEAVANNQVQALTTDNVILVGLVQQYGIDEYRVVNNPFTAEPYGIGLKKGDDAFRSFINDTLEASFDDGSWAKAYESTIGIVIDEVPDPPKVDRY